MLLRVPTGRGNPYFKEKLLELPSVNKILVYGTRDDEYYYVPALKELQCDNLEILEVKDADHKFKGMLDEYIALSDLI